MSFYHELQMMIVNNRLWSCQKFKGGKCFNEIDIIWLDQMTIDKTIYGALLNKIICL